MSDDQCPQQASISRVVMVALWLTLAEAGRKAGCLLLRLEGASRPMLHSWTVPQKTASLDGRKMPREPHLQTVRYFPDRLLVETTTPTRRW
jgi:hypothetical protein